MFGEEQAIVLMFGILCLIFMFFFAKGCIFVDDPVATKKDMVILYSILIFLFTGVAYSAYKDNIQKDIFTYCSHLDDKDICKKFTIKEIIDNSSKEQLDIIRKKVLDFRMENKKTISETIF